jgi:pimeloyl-ACP methyl ester carboxylesterase
MMSISNIATSADGVAIHYEVYTKSSPVLLFVHGWCCDRSYRQKQIDHFSAYYGIVTMDLAGHGASGLERAAWTIPAFAEDVVAVVEALDLAQVVLIGHAYSGAVIVEAALRMPTRVVGLVAVDAFRSFDPPRSPEEMEALLAPFRANFVETMHPFVGTMFAPTADPILKEWIINDMAAAPPHVAIGAGAGQNSYISQMERALQALQVPIRAIIADFLPIDKAAAQQHGIAVEVIAGTGHFPMLEKPEEFNHLLEKVVQAILAR